MDADLAASLKDKVSPEEWRARVDLAALYRLTALHGWDDLIYTHISARVPGPEHHFLINPYGLLFEEMTASSLIKVDLDGQVLQETRHPVNRAGFTIHSALHANREDAAFVLHLHSEAGVAVSAHRQGLLPLTQHALIVRPRLAYHDYEGIAFHLDERERLAADLGDKSLMLLRNHGALAVGPTAGDCWVGIYYLEKACRMQVLALSAGEDQVMEAPLEAQAEVERQTRHARDGALIWPGCLRKLGREAPGYDH